VIHVYAAGGAQPLAARLAGVWAGPVADPFTPEWLAVPSDGMRRWLTLELARHLGASPPGGDGVVANVIRAYPGTLRSCVLTAARGQDHPDPWDIDRLVWSVLAALDRGGHDPGLGGLSTLPAGGSRFARARRVADLFDRYHLHRSAMIRSWAAGRDVDSTGEVLASHDAWQPHLWRLVRRVVDQPSPPEEWPELLGRVAGNELALDLPPRLTLFGFTLLPGGGFLELAQAVAVHRDVHLFLLEPSRFDADDLRRASPRRPRSVSRPLGDEPTEGAGAHPLLQSWGRLHRETALILADAEADGMPARQWVDESTTTLPSSLLGRLQNDIRANNGSGGTAAFDRSDRSVQFHACFGPTRQVEALRDTLLHLLDDGGPELTEEDILVVCPSLERFAPLIEAVFGPSVESPSVADDGRPTQTGGGAPALRYRIADRSLRSTNPCLAAMGTLVDLVSGRFESTAVLDFLALGPVRVRFDFDDDDLDDIAGWVAGTEVRWGIDPAHRQGLGVPPTIDGNTWQAALDRLLTGAALDGGDMALAVGDVSPYGVEGAGADTVGRLAEAIGYLSALVAETYAAKPVADWVEALRRACDGLFAYDDHTRWQKEALDRLFDDAIQSAMTGDSPSSTPLDFVDVRRLWAERLEAIPGRADYFRGGITVSSMTPLRGVPFRVVCLLGMDQEAFGPMSAAGDDLVAAAPELGDPDPRAEMRQSLLEAVLGATDCLVVVRDGRDVRSNQAVPRPVVVAELFEAVTRLADPLARTALAASLEIDHPRQAFDEKCFSEGGLRADTVWGFDRGDLDAARARRSRISVRDPFLAEPLAPSERMEVEFDQLHAFFKNPVAYFIGQRLEAHLPAPDEEPSVLLPVELSGLDRWRVASRLLEARLAGIDTDRWASVERQRSTLPPGSLGQRIVEACAEEVEAVAAVATSIGVGDGPPDPFEIEVTLPSGIRILGTVPLRLPDPHRGPARLSYSRLKPEHRVRAWLDLMALVATDPRHRWRSVAVGRPKSSGGEAELFDVGVVGGETEWRDVAEKALEVAVDCYRRGLREPLPLFPNFSYAVHTGRAGPADWSDGRTFPDGDGPAVVLAFGGIGFDEVLALPARPGDPDGEGDRVLRFARYLFGTIDATTACWPDLIEEGALTSATGVS
jgi:exodeoxyribonuclease V gamma subunit